MLGELQEETQQKQELIEDKIRKLAEESNVLRKEVGQLQADLKEDDVSFLKVILSFQLNVVCPAVHGRWWLPRS